MIGIDEVGRGAWAGPMLVVGIAWDKAARTQGLGDSKGLSANMRRSMLPAIQSGVIDMQTCWIKPSTIDEIGLTKSLRLACGRIFSSLSYLNLPTIIDGNINYLEGMKRVTASVKADDSIPAVSAASIVAKELRDAYMRRVNILYPGYGFAEHVGYGTARHKQALAERGATPLHRQSFRPVNELGKF